MTKITLKRREWLQVLETLEDNGKRAEMGYLALRLCRFYLSRSGDGANHATIKVPGRIATEIDRILDELYGLAT